MGESTPESKDRNVDQACRVFCAFLQRKTGDWIVDEWTNRTIRHNEIERDFDSGSFP